MDYHVASHAPDFWPQLLALLRESGVNHAALSRALNCHPSTVCRWAQGINRPKFDDGATLIELARKRDIAFPQFD